MNFLKDPWPFWLSGLIIGIQMPLMYYFFNNGPGTSSGSANLLKLIIPKSKLKWLNTERVNPVFNRNFYFIIGIILGGFISKSLSGDFKFTFDTGLFSQNVSFSFIVQLFWYFLGGTIIAIGARFADGCTSGNSIHGMSTLQPSGFVASMGFMFSAVVITWLMHFTILKGVM